MIRYVLQGIVFLLLGAVAFCQQKIVSIAVSDTMLTHSGKEQSVELTMDISSGWFIYPPTPLNIAQSLQVVQLKFQSLPDGIKTIGDATMPSAKLVNGHEVYAGKGIIITQKFSIDPSLASGEYFAAGRLTYQACSNTICYPPVEEKVFFSIQVVQAVTHEIPELQEVLACAAQTDKHAFVIFHSSGCGWCRKMDTAMNNKLCRQYFSDNYIVSHLTVYDMDTAKNSPGALSVMQQFEGKKQGVPYFMIFDPCGNLIVDSQIRPPGHPITTIGENIGCPVEEREVSHFLSMLRKTSSLTEKELRTIGQVFSEIR